MNASFTPHEVDPGWWHRWPRDAGALIGRQPLGFALMVLLVTALAFVPQNSVTSAPVSILIGALVMSWSRSADHHVGTHIWTMLKSSLQDAARLAWNVFVYVLIFTVFIALLYSAAHAVVPASGAHHVSADPRWTRIPPWIRSAFETAQNDQLVSISPWSLFMVYIALSMGHPGFWHLSHQSLTGMAKNLAPATIFMLIGLTPSLFPSLVHHLGTQSGVVLSVVGVSVLNVALILLGYIFAREVYEGQKRNVPTPRRMVVASTRTEGQLARVLVR